MNCYNKYKQQYNNYVRAHINNVRKGANWIFSHFSEDELNELLPNREVYKFMVRYLGGNDKVEDTLEYIKKFLLDTLLINHDITKFSIEEFNPYANRFYYNESDNIPAGLQYSKAEREAEFEKAWLHHIHNNPHHWNYWVLVDKKNKIDAMEIPDVYIFELICDWLSFSYYKSKPMSDIKNYYDSEKDNMLLAPNTRKKIERYIDLICKYDETK